MRSCWLWNLGVVGCALLMNIHNCYTLILLCFGIQDSQSDVRITSSNFIVRSEVTLCYVTRIRILRNKFPVERVNLLEEEKYILTFICFQSFVSNNLYCYKLIYKASEDLCV